MKRLVALASITVCVALLLMGCSAQGPRLTVSASPRSSEMDAPLDVRVSGLSGRQSVTIQISATDYMHARWRGSATYEPSANGTVDTATSVPQSGYRGAAEAGLVASMTPVDIHSADEFVWPYTPVAFTVTARADGQTASTVVHRAFPEDVMQQNLGMSYDGFIGTYAAAPGPGPHPAVLMLGGSEGGNSMSWRVPILASHGISTLSIAYFEEPGLPQTLTDIPLEYFARALTWLRSQPGIDPSHVWVAGASRGSEAAELLGVYFPNLVNGVIAASPGNVVLCGFPTCSAPAWTIHGAAIPYTHAFGPVPYDNPAAVIPVNRIKGPLLTICGGDDKIWNSCPDAAAMTALLTAAGDRYPHESLSFPDSGHGVGLMPAYEPFVMDPKHAGTTPPADALAAAKSWPALIAFIQHNS